VITSMWNTKKKIEEDTEMSGNISVEQESLLQNQASEEL